MTSSRPRSLLALATAFLIVGAAAPPESPVADAAMRGDRTTVRELLQRGADVNEPQGDGMTALHWAADLHDAEMAEMLIYAGARVDPITRNGRYTPLHLASQSGSGPIVRLLLDAGADANALTTAGGATPLHFAARSGSPDAVAALIDGGAVVDAVEVFGQTPLMWAAANGRNQAIAVLLDNGADIAKVSQVQNIGEFESELSEKRAAQRRIEEALRAAQNPDAAAEETSGRGGGGRGGARGGRGGRGGGQASGAAAGGGGRGGRGNADAGAQAGGDAQAGADAQAAEETKPEPPPYPIVDPATSSIRLDNPGYSDLIGDKGGLTPLLFAAREGRTETALALLDAGADVNQVSEGDHTSPMLMAIINGHFDMAMEFLARGADPNLASDAGAAPLYATLNVEWAAKALYPQPVAQKQQKTTYLEMMKALLDAGADVNARLNMHLWYASYNFDLLRVNTTGATPFWRAAYATDVPAMRLLKEYGADHTIATVKTGGGRGRGADNDDDGTGGDIELDPSGLPPIPTGGPGVYPIHAASGAGYGEGYAANAHQHAPDGWLPAMKYLIEELGVDPNQRDMNGFTAMHHAAARGDNELILYLVEQGGDVTVVSRRGQTTADMANGPVQRVPPFVDTVKLLEELGSKNNHNCRSC